jgi:hypothetical protein
MGHLDLSTPRGKRLWLLLPPWGKVGKGVVACLGEDWEGGCGLSVIIVPLC